MNTVLDSMRRKSESVRRAIKMGHLAGELFKKYHGRSPNDDELQMWTQTLISFGEAAVCEVEDAFVEILLHPSGNVLHWTSHRGYNNMKTVRHDIAFSDEGKQKVTALFQKYHNRSPNSKEVDDWRQVLMDYGYHQMWLAALRDSGFDFTVAVSPSAFMVDSRCALISPIQEGELSNGARFVSLCNKNVVEPTTIPVVQSSDLLDIRSFISLFVLFFVVGFLKRIFLSKQKSTEPEQRQRGILSSDASGRKHPPELPVMKTLST